MSRRRRTRRPTRFRSLLALAAALSAGLLALCGSPAAAQGAPPDPAPQAVLVLVNRVTLEDLLTVPVFRQLARAGGAAIMTTRHVPGHEDAAATAAVLNGTPELPPGPTSLLERTLAAAHRRLAVIALDDPARVDAQPGLDAAERARLRATALRVGGVVVGRAVAGLPEAPTLVVVAAPLPDGAAVAAGDEVAPLIVATGLPGALLPPNGAPRTLTSDTTRRTGLVSNADVAPTILRFFGLPVPPAMTGSAVRVVDAAPPLALHRRHLEQRRIRLPVQMGELALVVAAALVAVAALLALAGGSPLPRALTGGLRAGALLVVALPVAVFAGGALPHLTYAWVVPFLVLGTAALAALAGTVRGRGSIGPFALLGAVGLAVLAADALLGGRAMGTPLFGGTMFDGVRYFGLPNAFIGLLLGSAILVAATLRPWTGFVLLVAAGLFAGFPSLGANVGGAITLFFAAGLWLALRTRGRVGLREAAGVAAVTIAGLAVVLLAARVLPGAPTHATRFVRQEASQGLGHALSVIGDRLAVGLRMIERVPAAVLPLLGFAGIGLLAARRAGVIGDALGEDGSWRPVVLVVAAAALVAYLANDTGAAAADPAFVYVMAGITVPAMRLADVRREAEAAAGPRPPGEEAT